MKSFFSRVSFSVVAITLLSTTIAAQAAAKKPIYKAPPPAAAPLYSAAAADWTGFYLGINGGVGWRKTGGLSNSGALFGGTIGYNFQTGPTVFGVEADLDWSGVGDQRYLGTVRGRLGFAAEKIMPYLTGGLAFSGDNGAGNTGWTLGAGFESRVNQALSIKAEYLYAELSRGDVRENILRLGLNWRLGAAGPVVARY
jgi:outer membrane immunogenic protein